MNVSLLLAALLMGLAGSVHCTAMCGAACTAVAQRCGGAAMPRALLGFHVGRFAGYAAGGALAAASVGALAAWSQASPALRPLWTLVHAAALMLGLWLAWTGRQPSWLAALGRAPVPSAVSAGWRPVHGPLRGAAVAATVGGAWVLLPCGLLQSALLVAALASDAVGGAMVMGVFALASSLGLLMAGAAWQRFVASPTALRWAVRLAGAMLAGASAWALGHGLWMQIAAYCFG
jgi:sulfite exporter TauE/SafE